MIAGAVGAVRFVSITKSLQLKMRSFPTDPIVQAHKQGKVVHEEVVKIAVSRSGIAIDTATCKLIEAEASSVIDNDLACSGHDLMATTATLIGLKWGGQSGRDALAAAFQSAVSCLCWSTLSVVQQLTRWAESHGRMIWDCEIPIRTQSCTV